jgi:type IV pilus biogenesis protein CpaD/CtpE
MAYCGPRGIPLHEFLTWPDHSQQAALSWQSHEARRCPACGTHPEDWTKGEDEQRHWHERVCLGCARRERMAAVVNESRDGTRGVGLELAEGPVAECPVCTVTR